MHEFRNTHTNGRKNLAGLEAIYYFTQILRRMTTPHVYSGVGRLYRLQSGGVFPSKLSREEDTLFAVAAPNGAIAEPPRPDVRYQEFLHILQCKNYITTLWRLVRDAQASTRWQYREQAYRLGTFPSDALRDRPVPSPVVFERMSRFVAQCNRVDNFNIVKRDVIQALDNLNLVTFDEVLMMGRRNGRNADNPLNPAVMDAFLVHVAEMLGQSARPSEYGLKEYWLPLLEVMLHLTQITTGSVWEIPMRATTPIMGAKNQVLKLSDETLCALPLPNQHIAIAFAEPDARALSTLGILYLQRQEEASIGY